MSRVCCGSSFARAARQQPLNMLADGMFRGEQQSSMIRCLRRRAATSLRVAQHPHTIPRLCAWMCLADSPTTSMLFAYGMGLLCDPALQQAAAARYARSGRALGAPEVGCASDALVATRERRNREVERARATHCTVCRAVRAWGLPPCGGCKWVPPPTPTCLPASRGLAVVLGWLVRSCGTARSGPTGRARLRLCAGLFYGPGVRDCARYHEAWR